MMISTRAFSAVLVLAAIPFFSTHSLAQSGDRETLESEIRAALAELKELERQFLEPSAKDRRKNAEFLSQPETGLIRLLPRETFQDKLTIRGGGAYYSFARLTHEYGFGSDLELQQRQLSVGFAGADFGFLTRLGKKSLDGATLDDPAAQFLVSFAPPTIEAEAREQYQRGQAGFDVDGFTYSSREPLKAKNTYLLRSISYGRSDLLVAFRLMREDIDGSVIILWKILKRFPVPPMLRP
jgi:hypothetical protein